ncbi:hypothetical protein CSX12_13155 [Microbacterium sp. Y-01]|uniref:MBL fold metallo-hydrolase n=1 Tax=Microbacterium sp. Y-01 TaxID=2048898 RepID=UPI000F6033EB|nr:MBL fold metallo-hydrolase [Microbacterium sp. Y-01]AZH79324.1 hypothetical protein CSX12_13155 [Microbacterium sp. Y-01]
MGSASAQAFAKESILNTPWERVRDDVIVVYDTCRCYVVRTGPRTAIAIDFGSGAVLDHLAEAGLGELTDVFITHVHRDQVQGLDRLSADVRVWVPAGEHDVIAHAEEHWARQSPLNDYVLREQRFTPLRSTPHAVPLDDHEERTIGDIRLVALPTPGHTVGSVSYLVTTRTGTLLFTGDAIAAPGKVHSLAALQWNYVGVEGAESAILSALELGRHHADVLLPSHGEPITDPGEALRLLADNLQDYVDLHEYHPKPPVNRRPIRTWAAAPYVEVAPHLLMNVASHGRSYVLLSEGGQALLFDFGYDLTPGMPAGTERAARRPSLGSIPALKSQFGVSTIEVVAPTHYHDDHVAGINLLRAVEGTQVWCPRRFSEILAHPGLMDLPCQWFDPIVADRELASGESFRWREYEIVVHDLPGHTQYAVAYEVRVDGRTYLVTGDQQDGLGAPGSPDDLNYQYRNIFQPGDYLRSAELFARVRPDVMLSGHWNPREVDDEYIAMIRAQGEQLVEIHDRLLVDFDEQNPTTGFLARISPYLPTFDPDGGATVQVHVTNTAPGPVSAEVRLVLPEAAVAHPQHVTVTIEGRAEGVATFRVQLLRPVAVQTPLAADIVLDGRHIGQHAEALIIPSRTAPPTQSPHD